MSNSYLKEFEDSDLENYYDPNLMSLLKSFIFKSIEEKFKEYQNPIQKEKWLSTNLACKELNVSRQTLNNWDRNPRKWELINHCIRRVGGKNEYEVLGLKRFLSKTNSKFFRNKYFDRTEDHF